jgi:hydroxymethylbilane synthase
VSVENMKFGNVVTIKGLTDEKVVLNERRIEREDLPEWHKINKDAFFPNDLEKYNLFRRHVINESIEEVSSLKKKNIWVSRANAVPDQTKICQSNLLWVSGLKTWFKLSERGFWVNGTSDSLGENMNPGIDHLSENKNWVKLTHEDSSKNEFDEKIATYKLKRLDIKEDLSQKTHFYWMSGSAFEYVLERFPTISDCFHACGPGNTYEIIKKKIKEDKITIFLSYDEVAKNLINN